MEITEVRIHLRNEDRLKAFATVTFDGVFVVHNMKVVSGNNGLIVCMPSRKIKDPCPKCNFRNAVRSKFCNQCGATLPISEPKVFQPGDDAVRQSEHKDIAHPISAECRDYIQKKVLEAYENEKKASPSMVSVGNGAPSRVASRSTEEDNDIEL